MRKILVTGGAGFIGSNFIHYWLSSYPDDRLVNLDALTYAGNLENLKEVENHPQYSFIRGDVCDRSLIEGIFKKEEIDTVINFAAESHVDRSILGPEAFVRTNIHGTFTLLDVAKEIWGNSKTCRFLHVSTDEVYGSLEIDDPPFSETMPYLPNSPYSAAKASSDHLVRAYFHTYGLPVVTTNCSNNYGPYQFPEKLIPLVIINALQGKALPVYGDGMNVRDWLHVDDHCRGIAAAVHRGKLGETYNIGGGNEWTNIDIVKLICNQLDKLAPGDRPRAELITFVKDRPGHDRRYAIDATKITNELGWKALSTFESGIEQSIKWYLSNQAWWQHVLNGGYRDYYRLQYGGNQK